MGPLEVHLKRFLPLRPIIKLFELDTTIATDFWNYDLTGVCMHNLNLSNNA